LALKTDYVCPFCSENYLKDSSINGDYDEGGILLSFCPRCGRMYQIVLSNNRRKIIAIRLSMRCDLDFNDTKQILNDAPQHRFIDYILESLQIVKEDILAVLEDKDK